MKNILLSAILLCTISSFGQTTFERTYGEGNIHSGFTAMNGQQTKDAGYIIVGTYSGQSSSGVCVVKTDYKGDTLWIKSYWNILAPFNAARSVQQTADNGYIITGSTSDGNGTSPVVYLIRTDYNGDTLWTRTYVGAKCEAFEVQQTNDGGFIIAGAWGGSYDQNTADAYLLKINSTGNIQWTKTYGGTASDYAIAVRQTNDNGYIVMGRTGGFDPTFPIFLVKTDSNGDTLWTRKFGGKHQTCLSFTQTLDGGYALTGTGCDSPLSDQYTYLLKTDANGNYLWTKKFYETSGIYYAHGRSVDNTKDGGYLIAGECSNGINASFAFLMKTDSVASIKWSKKYSGQSQYFDVAHKTYDNGYILIGNASMPASPAFYLVKTDSLGNSCNSTTLSMSEDTVTILSGNAPAQLSSGGIENNTKTNVYTGQKFSILCLNTGVEIEDHGVQTEILILPNPSSGIFTVSFKSKTVKMEICVYDVLGNCLLKKDCLNDVNPRIDLSCQPRGIYFMEIVSDGERAVKKIVLE